MCDREEHVFERSFLAEDRERIRLPPFEVRDSSIGIDVIDIRNLDLEFNRQPALRCDVGLPVDDRIGIPIIDDALETDVPKPPRCFSGAFGKPKPVIGRIAVRLAVRLDDVAGRNDGIVQPAPMNATMRANGPFKLFGDPRAVPMSRRMSSLYGSLARTVSASRLQRSFALAASSTARSRPKFLNARFIAALAGCRRSICCRESWPSSPHPGWLTAAARGCRLPRALRRSARAAAPGTRLYRACRERRR